MKEDNPAQPPIFIHAWWRSGSTYIWAKLRQSPHLCCYYEPFHEQLKRPDLREFQLSRQDQISAALRHPEVDRHYFEEYTPLVSAGQLQFLERFAYQSWHLRRDQDDGELRDYLQRLIGSANREGRRPVLCFVRSQLRCDWIQQNCGGVQIGQIRNPLSQWRSFGVLPYFRMHLSEINSGLHEKFPELFSRDCTSNEDQWNTFMTLYVLQLLKMLSTADFVLDIDCLTAKESYRRMTQQFFLDYHIAVDFADCECPISDADVRLDSILAPWVRKMRAHAKLICGKILHFDHDNAMRNSETIQPGLRNAIESLIR